MKHRKVNELAIARDLGAWSGHPCVGSSILVGPDGAVQASGGYGSEEIIYAEVAPRSSRPD